MLDPPSLSTVTLRSSTSSAHTCPNSARSLGSPLSNGHPTGLRAGPPPSHRTTFDSARLELHDLLRCESIVAPALSFVNIREGGIVNNAAWAQFGRLTQAVDPRIMQFALKLLFLTTGGPTYWLSSWQAVQETVARLAVWQSTHDFIFICRTGRIESCAQTSPWHAAHAMPFATCRLCLKKMKSGSL